MLGQNYSGFLQLGLHTSIRPSKISRIITHCNYTYSKVNLVGYKLLMRLEKANEEKPQDISDRESTILQQMLLQGKRCSSSLEKSSFIAQFYSK